MNCCEEGLIQEYKQQNGGNFQDNGSEFYPKAIYDAIHILNDEYRTDFETGARTPKRSAHWYAEWIKNHPE